MTHTQTGTVLSIERCSLHDGPGIRTTVFLKGCPLKCLWCHNPESRAFAPELSLVAQRCTRCGRCRNACPAGAHRVSFQAHEVDRSLCRTCGQCVEACPAGALEVKGTARTVEAVLEEVEKDRAYYESSGGGLTLSGGEPTAQFEFCKALLVGARQARLHTCLETSALAGQDKLLRLNELVDLFLIDWKESDPDRHVEFTGASHDAIHRNIVALDEAGAKLLLRCPIVPGLNDRADHFRGIALLAGKLENVQGIEVMGYHPMGASKARNVGKQYPLPDVPQAQPQQVRAWREAISAHTSVKVF